MTPGTSIGWLLSPGISASGPATGATGAVSALGGAGTDAAVDSDGDFSPNVTGWSAAAEGGGSGGGGRLPLVDL